MYHPIPAQELTSKLRFTDKGLVVNYTVEERFEEAKEVNIKYKLISRRRITVHYTFDGVGFTTTEQPDFDINM